MKILCLGDVVGKYGCEAVRNELPVLKQKYNIDLVIINGENSAEGNGILPGSAEHLFTSGADVITGGNHSFRRREIYDRLDNDLFLLRPANFPDYAVGHGSCICDLGKNIVGVINLMGVVYLEPLESPFDVADREIERLKNLGANIIIVDIHAEATGEKKSLAHYLDGRVSAVFGTHTHVQTNDDQILPNGTGYISDIGMCGPYNSVLGINPAIAIEKMRTKMPIRFENAVGDCIICGCIFEVDEKSGKTIFTEKINIKSAME